MAWACGTSARKVPAAAREQRLPCAPARTLGAALPVPSTTVGAVGLPKPVMTGFHARPCTLGGAARPPPAPPAAAAHRTYYGCTPINRVLYRCCASRAAGHHPISPARCSRPSCAGLGAAHSPGSAPQHQASHPSQEPPLHSSPSTNLSAAWHRCKPWNARRSRAARLCAPEALVPQQAGPACAPAPPTHLLRPGSETTKR